MFLSLLASLLHEIMHYFQYLTGLFSSNEKYIEDISLEESSQQLLFEELRSRKRRHISQPIPQLSGQDKVINR